MLKPYELTDEHQDKIINMLGKPTPACADCSTGLCHAAQKKLLEYIIEGMLLDQGGWIKLRDDRLITELLRDLGIEKC